MTEPSDEGVHPLLRARAAAQAAFKAEPKRKRGAPRGNRYALKTGRFRREAIRARRLKSAYLSALLADVKQALFVTNALIRKWKSEGYPSGRENKSRRFARPRNAPRNAPPTDDRGTP